MMTAEQNFRLLQDIDANRRFLLEAYRQNPKLLEHAEARIKDMFETPVSQNGAEAEAGDVLNDHETGAI